jgi:hypothetical protein
VTEEKLSSHEISGYKNPYHWVLEEAGAKVFAFQDFGSYQGDWLAKVEYKGKQGWIRDCYGSCSGCDSFEAESRYENRTKKEWHDFATAFAKDYLDEIRSWEEVYAEFTKEEEDWDTDRKEIVKFLEENK